LATVVKDIYSSVESSMRFEECCGEKSLKAILPTYIC
jgi:hypothetical protein